MGNYKYKPAPNTKQMDVKTAKELGYSKTVLDMLKNENNPDKRQRILHDARKSFI